MAEVALEALDRLALGDVLLSRGADLVLHVGAELVVGLDEDRTRRGLDLVAQAHRVLRGVHLRHRHGLFLVLGELYRVLLHVLFEGGVAHRSGGRAFQTGEHLPVQVGVLDGADGRRHHALRLQARERVCAHCRRAHRVNDEGRVVIANDVANLVQLRLGQNHPAVTPKFLEV